MSGQVVGYVRVSAADQSPDRQIEVLGQCHKIFTEKISGKSRAKRQALTGLLEYIREGDTVRVASTDRLGRDTRDLYNLVAEMTEKGAAVEFVHENIMVYRDGASPLDALMLGILAAFAEFERNRIRERQAEGIALAKAKGKYVQQPKLGAKDIEQAQTMIAMGIPKTQVAAILEVSRQTLYNALRRVDKPGVRSSSCSSMFFLIGGEVALDFRWAWCRPVLVRSCKTVPFKPLFGEAA